MVYSFPHWHLTLATVFHGLTGYSAFFYMTLLNPIELWVKDLANSSVIEHYGVRPSEQTMEWVWAGTSTSRSIGVLIGCATLTYLAEKLGRRNTMMILKNVILISSGCIKFFSRPLNSIELLIIGRILDGIAFALTFIIPIYLAESSPTEFRGLVSSAPILGGRMWAFSGALLPLLPPFSSEQLWHYLFLCPVLPSLINLLTTPLFPKSIKHLLITNENRKLSRKATQFYYGPNVHPVKLWQDMEKEAHISPTMKMVNLKVLLATKQFRQPWIICVVVFLMMSGGDHILNQYSTGILRSVGVPPVQALFYSALAVQLPVIFVSLLGVLCLESFGCRPILLTGIAVSVVGSTFLTLGTPLDNAKQGSSFPPVVRVSGLLLTVFGLTAGPDLLFPILPGELAPQASRTLTLGVSRFVGTVASLVFGFAYPPLSQSIGTYAFLPQPLLGMFGFVFLLKSLPESKDKAIYEIVQPWMPKRKQGNSKRTPAKATNETKLRDLTHQQIMQRMDWM